MDDYRKLLEVHLQAQYESSSTFDISHLFENDDYISDITIKDVDANYGNLLFRMFVFGLLTM